MKITEQIGTGWCIVSSYFRENGEKARIKNQEKRQSERKCGRPTRHICYIESPPFLDAPCYSLFRSHLHFIITRIYPSLIVAELCVLFFFKCDAFITPSTSQFHIGHLFAGSASNQTDQDIPLICQLAIPLFSFCLLLSFLLYFRNSFHFLSFLSLLIFTDFAFEPKPERLSTSQISRKRENERERDRND